MISGVSLFAHGGGGQRRLDTSTRAASEDYGSGTGTRYRVDGRANACKQANFTFALRRP